MPEIARFILLLIASYLVGAIPFGYLLVRWRYKVDVRHYGSGGIGGSNVFNSFSKPLGIVVGLFDAGKGALMVWIAHLAGLGLGYEIVIGVAVISGHNWPVFMGFNAGRGLATTLGVAIYLFPFSIWVFIAGAIFTLLIGSSPLPVLVGVALFPIASALRHEPLTLTLGMTVLFLLLVLRRLSAPRTERSRQGSTRELLLNRFLFDRDIRDGKAWLTVKPVTVSQLKKKRGAAVTGETSPENRQNQK